MASIHYFIIKLRILERLEVTVPLSATQQNNMVIVHLADSSYPFLINIFQFTVQFFHIRKIRSDRFIEKLITENHRFILIPVCNLAPDIAIQLLAGFTFKQPRISVAIIYIITRLSTRSIMHIKNQIKIGFTAPFHNTVYTGKTILTGSQPHKVLIREKLIMEWKTNGIRTCILNKLNIFTNDIIVFESFPKLSSKVGSYQLAEHFIDKPGRIRFVKLKHIPFRIQPIAQIGTHDKEFRTIRFYQVLPLNGYKLSKILYFFCLFTTTPQHQRSC